MSINKVTLFQLFTIVLVVGAVIGSKVNKERQLRQQQKFLSAGSSVASDTGDKGHHSSEDVPDFGYISDSQGLPTKFGDEDDVVFAKKHNDTGGHHLHHPAHPVGPGNDNHGQTSSVTNVKPPLSGHEHDYDYDDYEEELDHPDDNDSRDKDGGSSNHNHDIGDYTDGFDTDGIDQIESFGEGSDTASSLPVFLVEPKSAYVMKNRPAVLHCKASYAFQILFKCSGGYKPPLTTFETHVDPHTGIQMQEASTSITREVVDEFFGRGPFKCDCQAWSSRGVVRTQPATIQVACITWS